MLPVKMTMKGPATLPGDGKSKTPRTFTPGSHEPTPGRKSKGKVLIMDDEQALLEVTADMVRLLGYDVETALDGKEALNKFLEAKDASAPFEVVVMDLSVRAGMDGREAVRCILTHDPKARVIVSSGHSRDSILKSYSDEGFWDFIIKPYDLKSLGEKLAKAIQV